MEKVFFLEEGPSVSPQQASGEIHEALEDMMGVNPSFGIHKPGHPEMQKVVPVGPLNSVPRRSLGTMIPHDMRSTIPMSSIQGLFPGPIMIENGGAPTVDGKPTLMEMNDNVLRSMMEDMDKAFTEEVLPRAQRMIGEENAPHGCSKEANEYCKNAQSALHCLGKHADAISDTCRKSVSKSVPFLCSDAIDRFCDVLDGGILSCLAGKMQLLEGPCQDAVVSTRHLITKVNTQKASVTDPKTGITKTSTPKGTRNAPRMAKSVMTKNSLPPKTSSHLHKIALDTSMGMVSHPASTETAVRRQDGHDDNHMVMSSPPAESHRWSQHSYFWLFSFLCFLSAVLFWVLTPHAQKFAPLSQHRRSEGAVLLPRFAA